MAKIYATFSVRDGEWTSVAGPNADYQGQRSLIMEARISGPPGGADELVMVDLKRGSDKRAKARTKPAAKKAAKKKTGKTQYSD